MSLYNSPVEKVCIENPRGWMKNIFRREDQVIEPFEFGHNERKRTCLWLRGLPPLMKTLLNPEGMKPKKVTRRPGGSKKGGMYGHYFIETRNPKYRAKTFQGIANAMADQWG